MKKKIYLFTPEQENELRNLMIHLKAAAAVRTFPNGKKLPFNISKALNLIGQDIDQLTTELAIIIGDREPFDLDYKPDSRIHVIPLILQKTKGYSRRRN